MAKKTTSAASTAYALASIKSLRGEETPCFEAKVTLNGKTIGQVRNSGIGGPHEWRFDTHEDRKAFFAFIKATVKEKFEPEDAWAYAQLEKHEETQQLMRWSRKAVIYKIDSHKKGTYGTVKHPDTSKVKAYLAKKYAGQNPQMFDRDVKQFVPCRA